MKKYIYFHVDELYRDLITSVNLKKFFPSNKYKFIYGSRRNYRLLLRFSDYFDAVVFPKPQFLSYAKDKNWTSFVYYLYTENIGIIAKKEFPKMILKGVLDEHFMMGNNHFVDSAKGFFLWGNNAYKTINKYYPYLKNKIHVVGHPRHDLLTLKSKTKPKLNDNNLSIGILTRNCFLNDYIHSSALENLSKYINLGIPYEYYKSKKDFLLGERRGSQPAYDVAIESIDTKNIFLIISELSKNFKNLKIYFKIHPRENHENWHKVLKKINLNIEICEKEIPFTHWLKNLDYVIGPPSTSFYDACMMNVMPISIHNLDKKRNIFIKKMYEENNELTKHVYSPKSIQQLITFIKKNKIRYKNNKKILKILYDEANYPNCKNSLKKISNIIKEDLMHKKNTKNKIITINMRIIFNILYFLLNLFFRKEIINSSNFRFGPRVNNYKKIFE